VNAPGAGAYPIASFTWLLVYRGQADSAKAAHLKAFLHWYLTTGEQSAASLDYAPLPPAMIQRLSTRVDSLGTGT